MCNKTLKLNSENRKTKKKVIQEHLIAVKGPLKICYVKKRMSQRLEVIKKHIFLLFNYHYFVDLKITVA